METFTHSQKFSIIAQEATKIANNKYNTPLPFTRLAHVKMYSITEANAKVQQMHSI
ncbi:hypothetical protein NLO413_0173 [Candidatus Neoehrlichia lotoris str. RAC413]|uniref:Uncharacterized protein n=1 Tax=Candidatus Neoehrlichia procyonis str. RAC413 TaxID=1359163 RepID=A0A0F3NL74_9RICK|nr:hypothetical protein NLO413_0173 [Candidatus Neoehrlichia lotoris str. RAC413]